MQSGYNLKRSILAECVGSRLIQRARESREINAAAIWTCLGKMTDTRLLIAEIEAK